jgi:hypothetical protein
MRCKHCEPPIVREKPRYPPTDTERAPMCPMMDLAAAVAPEAVREGCAGMSSCVAATYERERQQLERQEREVRERLNKERIEMEKKEIERREQDLKARERYICPGRAQKEKAELETAKKAHSAGKLLDRNDKFGDEYGDLRRIAQEYPKGKFGPCAPVQILATNITDLRDGTLPNKCICRKNNGLQHECMLSLCNGRPECLTNPPVCIPSGGRGYISPCFPVCEPTCWSRS